MIDPAVLAAMLAAFVSGVLGLLGYRRSMHNDEVAERAGIASTQSASIGQVIDGQDKLIENLQAANLVLRQENAALRALREGRG